MSRDIIEFFVAVALAVAILVPVTDYLDRDWELRRNAYYGNVDLQAGNQDLDEWAEAQDSSFMVDVAFEVGTPFNGSADQVALHSCLVGTIGGSFDSVVVYPETSDEDVIGATLLCMHALNYYHEHFDEEVLSYREWFLLSKSQE
jgi:hypothetical protein